MWLVSLHMRRSVARKYIFGNIWRRYGPKWDILDYWRTIIFFYYPIIYYQRIKVYRVETMDMGISHWNIGVIGACIVSIITTVIIVRDMILW